MLGIFFRILKSLFGCFFGCFVLEISTIVKGINIGFSVGCFLFSITDESEKTEVQVILIEVDLFNDIQIENTLHIPTTEAPTEHIDELIVTSEMTPDIGPIIQLNTVADQPTNTTESTGKQEVKTTDSDDAKNNAEIENVVENLLRAINAD